nr:DNA-directed DNA polymerase [Tanacetum cinerariifolium]
MMVDLCFEVLRSLERVWWIRCSVYLIVEGYVEGGRRVYVRLIGNPISNPTPSTNSNPKGRNRRRSKQRIKEFNLDELSPPIVMMADQRTMAQLLQAPTEGYEDAIVIPAITADNVELNHGLLTLVQNKQFCGHDKQDPQAHVQYFNKITSTLKFPNVQNTQKCLAVIESKSKVRYSCNKPVVAKVSTNTSTSGISPDVAELKDMVKALLLDKKSQNQAPATVKAVKKSYVTCGGAHSYRNCPAINGNIYRDNIQEFVSQASAVNYNQQNTSFRPPMISCTLPSNTIANSRSDLKAITTRSGVSYNGPQIPPSASFLPKVVENKPEVTKDTVNPTNNRSTKDVQPQVVQSKSPILTSEPVNSPISELVAYPNKLSLPDLTPTCMTLELADRLISRTVGVAEEVYVKVGSFHFSANFVVVDFDADPRVPLILERSFLKTGRALIDMFECELTLLIGKEAITFNLDQTSRYSANYSDMTVKQIDVINMACEEYSQEVLGFSDVIASGNPTPYYDPIVSTTSLTLTPFGNSDFLLEEVDAFLAIEDEPTLPEVDQYYLDPEGDILLLEAFLNDDPSLPPLNQGNYLPEVRKELKICEAKSDKSLIDEPPEVELKDLPPHLGYVFLEGDDKLPVIIAKDLSVEEKTALITGGFTVVENEDNELILTRLVTGWCVCIDYRKLNEATRKDHFPLPFMDQMLKSLAGNQYYYFLDGFSGYFQILIDLKDQEKNTFTYPYGTFCLSLHAFWVMQYTRHVSEEKSHFMVEEGIVLDHKISKQGIEVDKAKMDFITKLPHPTTIKGIRSFLGHAGFYRHFIKDFSKIARPMTRLLEKDTPFIFFKECVEAFQTLKRKLPEAPILIAPDRDVPFELMCDASDFAIGTVLGQRQDKHFRPIHYASKTMTEAESNYTTTKKEMLSVVYAFEKFRSYLIMKKSIVYTDHSALKYLFAKKDSKVMQKFGVTHRLATLYHPQTSGQVEVSNRGLKRILERTLGENRASWSDKLDDALWAFRTAYKTPIRCTPYKLVYGKACHLPIKLEHKAYWALKHANFDLKTAGDHRKVQLNELNELRDQAYENSFIYKEKTKRLHDSKIKDRVFNIGDRVLLFNSRLKIFSNKLKSHWSGSFTISHVYPYGTVELSQPDGPNFKVNAHRFKNYFGEDVPKVVVC